MSAYTKLKIAVLAPMPRASDSSGEYLDASNLLHGFLRTPDGTITTFDAPIE